MSTTNPVTTFAESPVLAGIRERLLLARSFIAQHDGLYSEVVGARYAAEMAKSRPQINPKVAEDTQQYVGRYNAAVEQLETFRGVIKTVTGQSVEGLRAVIDALVQVLGRYDDVKQELLGRTYVTPAMLASVVAVLPEDVWADGPTSAQRAADADATQAQVKLEEALAELPYMQENLARLLAVATDLGMHLSVRPLGRDTGALLTLGEK